MNAAHAPGSAWASSDRLFVDDAFDFGRREAVSGIVVPAIVRGDLTFAFELLVAVVRRPYPFVFRFSLSGGKWNNGQVIEFIVWHLRPPGHAAAIEMPTALQSWRRELRALRPDVALVTWMES